MTGSLLALAIAALALAAVAGAEAILWDLVVDADVGGEVVYGGNFTISGTVTDHAGLPEAGTIRVWAGPHSAEARAGPDGLFEATVMRSELLPGSHVVQIRADSADGRFGMASTHVRVEGEVRPSDHIARLLASEHAARYLRANATDFEGDPLGAKLYEYYRGLQEKMITQRAVEGEAAAGREQMQDVRLEADEILRDALEKHENGEFVYDERARKIFYEGLDESVHGTFVAQFEHTLDAYRSANAAMREILENGGTMEQAREAYALHASTSRDAMENLINRQLAAESGPSGIDADSPRGNSTTSAPEAPRAPEETPAPPAAPEKPAAPADSGDEDPEETIVYLTIDGVMTKHVYNGTHLVRAD